MPVENRHRDHILDVTMAPAAVPAEVAAKPWRMAERIARALELEGLLAVEMFLTRDGRLLVNELAPRPHNSGHWTIDACAVSQFEQQVRAVCGLPLGDPAGSRTPTMTNLIGDDVDALARPAGRARRAAASLRQARGPAGPQDGPRDAAASGDDVGDPVALEMGDAVLERQLLLLQPLQLDLVAGALQRQLADALIQRAMRGPQRLQPGVDLRLDRPFVHYVTPLPSEPAVIAQALEPRPLPLAPRPERRRSR